MSGLVLLAVLVAGAIGAVIRFAIVQIFSSADRTPQTTRFPWAILLVNTAGSGIGGLIFGLNSIGAISPSVTLIVLGGLCGGLTTFSTLSVDTVSLASAGGATTALANIAVNLGCGLGLAYLAFATVIAVHSTLATLAAFTALVA
jgi:CrcB protein